MKHFKRVGMVVAMAAVVGLLLAVNASIVFAYNLEELIALSNKIQNQKPGIDFSLSTDKKEYQTGEKVVFEFTSDKECYLALIDVGTSGRVMILFPNKWHLDNKVEKGKTYRIPPAVGDYAYKVEGPAGTERIKAIACVEPALQNVQSLQQELRVPVGQDPSTGANFLSMKDPALVFKDIAVAMEQLDSSKWATADLTFKIMAAAPAAPASAAPPAAAPQTAPAPTSQPPAATPQPGQATPAQQTTPTPEQK